MFVFEGKQAKDALQISLGKDQSILNPGKELSNEKMEAILIFLPLFKAKRLELQEELQEPILQLNNATEK